MSKYTARRAQLQERHAQLVRRGGKIAEDLRSTHDPDSEERATELENDDVLERLDAAGRAEVGQIRAALDLIEAGLYGTCSVCGRPIAAERLAAAPTAITCVRCASRS